MDLSKVFDCIRHNLLLAKFDAYGLSRDSLRFIYSFLDNRHQRVKINRSFTTYKILSLEAPQRSALGPLLLNIYINALLLSLKKKGIYSYVDELPCMRVIKLLIL